MTAHHIRIERIGGIERITLARTLLDHDPKSLKAAINLVSVLHSAAAAFVEPEDQLRRTLDLSGQALAAVRKIYASEPGNSDVAAWVVRVLVGRTTPLIRDGRLTEALASTQEAMDVMERLDPQWSGLEKARLWRDVLVNRCISLRVAQRGTETGPIVRRRAGALRSLAEAAPPVEQTEYLLLLSDALSDLPDPDERELAEYAGMLDRFRVSDDPRTVLESVHRLTRAGRPKDAIVAADRVLSLAAPDQTLYISRARLFRGQAVAALEAGSPPRTDPSPQDPAPR